jgi:hypothetical protein
MSVTQNYPLLRIKDKTPNGKQARGSTVRVGVRENGVFERGREREREKERGRERERGREEERE